jgi:hypothetical protein
MDAPMRGDSGEEGALGGHAGNGWELPPRTPSEGWVGHKPSESRLGQGGVMARNTREYPLHLAFEAREGVAATKSLVFGAHREAAREGALNPPWS